MVKRSASASTETESQAKALEADLGYRILTSGACEHNLSVLQMIAAAAVKSPDPLVRRSMLAILAATCSEQTCKTLLNKVEISAEETDRIMDSSNSITGRNEPGLEERRRQQIGRRVAKRAREDASLMLQGLPFAEKVYPFRRAGEVLMFAMNYVKGVCNGDINPSKLHTLLDGTLLNFFRLGISYDRLYEGYRAAALTTNVSAMSQPYFTDLAKMITKKDAAKTCVLAPLVDYKNSVAIVIHALNKAMTTISIHRKFAMPIDAQDARLLDSGAFIVTLLQSSERFADAGGFYGHIRVPKQGYESADDVGWCECDGDSFHCAGYSNDASCSREGEPHSAKCSECLNLRLGPELAIEFFEVTLRVLSAQNPTLPEFEATGKETLELNDSIALARQLVFYVLGYYGSLSRGKSQNYVLKRTLKAFPNAVVAVVDYMNGFLPRKYLEPMADYFGKVGLGVLVCMFQYLEDDKVQTRYLDLVLSANTHSAQDFIALLPVIQQEAERIGRFELILQSDNASGFASHDIIPYIYNSNKTSRVFIRQFAHTEAGMGKTQADGHMCYLKITAVESSNNKMDITTPEEFYYALGGVSE